MPATRATFATWELKQDKTNALPRRAHLTFLQVDLHSLAPGFSRVTRAPWLENGFNRFPLVAQAKPLKRLSGPARC